MKQTAVALVGALAVALGVVTPSVSAQTPIQLDPYGQVVVPSPGTASQTPSMNPCPDGPQPMIVTRAVSGTVPAFVGSGFVTPGFFDAFSVGVGVPIVAGGFVALDRVTEIYNFNGVEGLVLTVFWDGFSRPVLSLGVPDYLLQAYGGNMSAIWQDLAAGHLKCRRG